MWLLTCRILFCARRAAQETGALLTAAGCRCPPGVGQWAFAWLVSLWGRTRFQGRTEALGGGWVDLGGPPPARGGGGAPPGGRASP